MIATPVLQYSNLHADKTATFHDYYINEVDFDYIEDVIMLEITGGIATLASIEDLEMRGTLDLDYDTPYIFSEGVYSFVYNGDDVEFLRLGAIPKGTEIEITYVWDINYDEDDDYYDYNERKISAVIA